MTRTFSTSVRDLVELVHRRGDINFRFSPRSSAMAGIRGHQRLQKARGTAYIAEPSVRDVVEAGDFEVIIRGRADGYMPDCEPVLVEEIKTTRSDARTIPAEITELHLGQAMVYAWLLLQDRPESSCVVRVCYLQLDDDSEVHVEQTHDHRSLKRFYDDLVSRFVAQLQRRSDWESHRNNSIRELKFPFDTYREGQRQLSASVYLALRESGTIAVEAPTGTGKTLATSFPAVKALVSCEYEKVFFLTPRTTGQLAARKAVGVMTSQGAGLRDVTLTAKDKVCLTPGAACHADQCEYARGYYDKLPGILADRERLPRSLAAAEIELIAREHTVCPFELSLDLAREADVVICDYNYVFDPSVYLRRFFDEECGRYAVLVDEGHNLVERGRSMFSAGLGKQRFLDLKRKAEPHPELKRQANAVNTAILKCRDDESAIELSGYVKLGEVPERLNKALRRFCEAAEPVLADADNGRDVEGLLELYFDVLRMLRMLERFDDDYALIIQGTGRHMRLELNNLNPSSGLAAGFARAAGAVLFSATLSPRRYYEPLIGVADAADWYRLPSPFPREHLGVFVLPWISTTWRDRIESREALVHAIHAVVAARDGNYIVYFPSYAYLEMVHETWRQMHPHVCPVVQVPGMSADEQKQFLDAFAPEENAAPTLGFAVMGGSFSEGVDLVGSSLIGAIVVGPALPQMGTERDLIRDHFGAEGFRFAYQYPGICRVIQTAGRVIRSEDDKGVVCLVDGRFLDATVQQALPAHWQQTVVQDQASLTGALNSFWCRADGADR